MQGITIIVVLHNRLLKKKEETSRKKRRSGLKQLARGFWWKEREKSAVCIGQFDETFETSII